MTICRAFFVATIVGLAGCDESPQIGGAQADAARNAPYPDLIQLDTLLNSAQSQTPRITPASISTTNDRIAGLRARAARLRGPVVDQATRARMRAASARAALR